jgi:hypothetical protein
MREIACRGEARRRRLSEIQQRSSVLLDTLEQIRREQDQWIGRGQLAQSGVARRPLWSDSQTDVGAQAEVLPVSDVIDQVQQLLIGVDVRERGQWNDDDTQLLLSLLDALAAAARKGYALGDVQAILAALNRSRSDR